MLHESWVALPDTTEVRVGDTTAELRFLALPEHPDGTEKLNQDHLTALVVRNSMIRVGLPEAT